MYFTILLLQIIVREGQRPVVSALAELKRVYFSFHYTFTGLGHGLSSDFGDARNYLSLNCRKLENNSLLRWENTTEIIMKHKGARMV